MTRATATARVHTLLGTVGGGRVLCLGEHAEAIVDAFRARAVDAVPAPSAADPTALPYADGAFDLVYVDRAVDACVAATDGPRRSAAIDELLRVAARAVFVHAEGRSRIAIEREWLGRACRKHPLHQHIVPFEGLDWEQDGVSLLFEPVRALATDDDALAPALAIDGELHKDMLREPGRRADAHVARYMFARQFVRPGDRVLDAACGLGYGTAILCDGTLAESVLGIDVDASAIAYARATYGPGRERASFDERDVMSLDDVEPGSVDVVVSFETLEHLEDPAGFLTTCEQILTPAGRLVCSVPNRWVNADGVDPNPHHLQVFDRARLETMCRERFAVERVFGQTAGGGMKLPEAGRRLWDAGDDDTADAEWWLLVGMKDSRAIDDVPFRHGLVDAEVDDRTNVLAFERDYVNPWLVRSMITIGLRTESDALLSELARQTIVTSDPASADAGGALCVQAYRFLDHGAPLPLSLRGQIARYLAHAADRPHVWRWQVSLRFVEALSSLQQGHMDAATRALEACAESDALRFSPLLATKTVGAAFLRGWIALQARDVAGARRWWHRGLAEAEAALQRPWEEILLNRETPALFGMREAAVVVDLASQCATGLALAAHAADRPGLVASQLFESLRDRASRRAGGHAAAPAAAPDSYRWSLLANLGDAALRSGSPDQLAKWDVTLDDAFARALLLHPPAVLDITIPTGVAGRLTTGVTIHPDAWGKPNAGACAFSLHADDAVIATAVVDPHRRDAHRRWLELSLDIPATTSGTHVLTLETQALDQPDFGWAMFREPIFTAA